MPTMVAHCRNEPYRRPHVMTAPKNIEDGGAGTPRKPPLAVALDDTTRARTLSSKNSTLHRPPARVPLVPASSMSGSDDESPNGSPLPGQPAMSAGEDDACKQHEDDDINNVDSEHHAVGRGTAGIRVDDVDDDCNKALPLQPFVASDDLDTSAYLVELQTMCKTVMGEVQHTTTAAIRSRVPYILVIVDTTCHACMHMHNHVCAAAWCARP
eukprot:3986126-Pyramimonas_sp.AAC.1